MGTTMDADEKPNILILNDNPETLHALEDLLQCPDINILSADSEQAALRLSVEHRCAAALLDLQLPGINGYRTAELLREHRGSDQIPIIFLSEVCDDLKRVFRGYEAAPIDYVFKPINPDILRNKVALFIEIYKQQEALKAANMDLQLTVEELQDANQKILEQQRSVIEEERLKILLQLSGATAHELNQPLTYLLGSIELLNLEKGIPNSILSHIEKIKIAGKKISEIVGKMNTLHRYETVSYHGDSEIINLDQKTNVLSIEDSDQDFLKISEVLKDQVMITLSRVKTIGDAMKALTEHHYDLVLMDYALSDGTGLEFLQKIQEKGLDIPVIAVTGKGDELIASRLIKAGAQDYLPKAKISKSSLTRSINNSMEKYRLQKDIRLANQKMAELAIKDALTNLYNRRYFIEALEKEVSRAERYNLDLSLCMIDLDHFKKINDNYGHIAGDMVLSETGRIIRESIRISDLACRYGGEEFAIIFPSTGMAEARRICERIKDKLGSRQFTHESYSFQVSMSAGIALFQGLNQTGIDLVGDADQALLRAKKEGRNNIVT
jgi:two-component system, cell cycle response regulator